MQAVLELIEIYAEVYCSWLREGAGDGAFVKELSKVRLWIKPREQPTAKI